MVLVLPSKKSFKLAASVLLLLAILMLLLAMTVWEVISQIEGALPIAYSLGALVGFLLRSAYDSAWGRDEIVSYIRALVPWLRVCKQE